MSLTWSSLDLEHTRPACRALTKARRPRGATLWQCLGSHDLASSSCNQNVHGRSIPRGASAADRRNRRSSYDASKSRQSESRSSTGEILAYHTPRQVIKYASMIRLCEHTAQVEERLGWKPSGNNRGTGRVIGQGSRITRTTTGSGTTTRLAITYSSYCSLISLARAACAEPPTPRLRSSLAAAHG